MPSAGPTSSPTGAGGLEYQRWSQFPGASPRANLNRVPFRGERLDKTGQVHNMNLLKVRWCDNSREDFTALQSSRSLGSEAGFLVK